MANNNHVVREKNNSKSTKAAHLLFPNHCSPLTVRNFLSSQIVGGREECVRSIKHITLVNGDTVEGELCWIMVAINK